MIFSWNLFLVIYKMKVNGYQHFESQEKHIREHKMNTRGSWPYIEFLWSETIGLCKKLNIICDPGPQNHSYGSIFTNWDLHIIWKLNK